MRIVHVLLGDPKPDTLNGVSKVVHYLATEHCRAGHDVEVWALTRKPNRPLGRTPEYCLRQYALSWGRFHLSRPLTWAVQHLPTQTWVQLHSVFIPEFAAIARILDRRRISFGITPHGGYSEQVFAKGRIKKGAYALLAERGLVRRAALVHALGSSEVNDIARLDPNARVVLVPNGQEVPGPLAESGSAPQDNPPIFIFCGRLTIRHKGLDILLQGFAIHRRRHGTGTLWIVGDGPDRDALKALTARLGLASDVHYLGAQFGSNRLRSLTDADVFVHPSRWDGVPTAALEAAAIGLPLIVSKESNLGDAVTDYDAGWVLPENEPESLADLIRVAELAHLDGRLQNRSRNAKEMVAREFAWPAIAATLAQHYAAAARGRR